MSESFGPYQVIARVAEGSTSTVYRARHVELEREAAIKELRPELVGAPGMRERLRAEAQTLSGLSDPNLVEVYDFVDEGERAWIAEEWVDGATLDRILEVHGPLSPEQSVGVVRGAVLGLAHAHDHGVLHRDVSPSNVLADLRGTSKLVDFGLAAPVGTSGFSGTPAYMSPEAARGEGLTKPSDVYSVAAVLYALLAGRAPYAGSDLPSTVRRITEDPVPVLESHGTDLQQLLRRSMAKDPAERPQDARVFLAELEEAARRRFGAAWLERASIAGLVGSAVPAAVGGGAAAPTVVVDSASILSQPAQKVVTSSGRKLAMIGAAGAVIVAGAVTIALSANGGDDAAAEDGSNASAQQTTTPAAVEEEPEPTLEDLSPSGTYTFKRVLVSSTYDYKVPKRETRVWTLNLDKCQQDTVCSGSIKSSSGSAFIYTWDGRGFTITPDGKSSEKYVGLCVDDQTGEEVPGTKGRAITTVIWAPLHASDVDADGIPTSLTGKERQKTTYEGLVDCDDTPTDRASWDVTITRR